jgi:hypothetical protein
MRSMSDSTVADGTAGRVVATLRDTQGVPVSMREEVEVQSLA